MEIVKAEPLQSFDDNESIYHFKIELIEINKIMIEIFNSRTGINIKLILIIRINGGMITHLSFKMTFLKYMK